MCIRDSTHTRTHARTHARTHTHTHTHRVRRQKQLHRDKERGGRETERTGRDNERDKRRQRMRRHKNKNNYEKKDRTQTEIGRRNRKITCGLFLFPTPVNQDGYIRARETKSSHTETERETERRGEEM